MKNINQKEFMDIAQNSETVILDVRRPHECASGMIPNAKMITFMNHHLFSSEISKLDKQKHYLVYCRSGNRSGRACMMMETLGFGNTYNLQGGMMAWRGVIN